MENLQNESGSSQEGVFPCDFEIYDRRTGNVTIADYVTRVEAIQGWVKVQLHNPPTELHVVNTRDDTCRGDKIEPELHDSDALTRPYSSITTAPYINT